MWNDRCHRRLFLLCLLLLFQLPHLYGLDFLFNGFRPSDLLLYGDAALFPATATTTALGVSPSGVNSSQYLAVTNVREFSVGRALYKSKVPMTLPNSSAVLPFSASFIFSIAPIQGTLPGHGIAFLFSPVAGIQGPATAQAAQHLGLFNRTIDGDPNNRVVAVEFDVFENEEFQDIDDNHVGIDVFSLTSRAAHPAGCWRDDDGSGSSTFMPLRLNDGSNYQAWVDYGGGKLNVTLAPVGLGSTKPRRPLISLDLDLSGIFDKEMYLGFCGATGRLVENHRVLGWSFSNSNLSLSQALVTTGLPNFVPPQGTSRSKAVPAVISAAVVATALVAAAIVGWVVLRNRRRCGKKGGWRLRKDGAASAEQGDGDDDDAKIEPWESEYWPHRIGYREILSATEGFSERNLIGCGGNGRVYKGVLGGAAVAVKQFLHHTGPEACREFFTEISTLGRLQHRNVVGLKGWCRRRGGDLILVYEYMENGSLDKLIFLPDADATGLSSSTQASAPLDWPTRVRVLKDVAAGILYLHEGWESRVLHRDIKSSNVMLNGDMVARLGDFGLARVHAHGGVPRTTRVVGTVGYMAPEVMRNGKATSATDVFGYGVVVLEVVCGRRAIVEGHGEESNRSSGGRSPPPPLAEWAWGLVQKGEASAAIDDRVRGTDGFDEEEAIWSLRLGLWCSCGDPAARPTMRQVVSAWNGDGGSVGSEAEGEVTRSAEAHLVERLRTATPPPPWSAPSMVCCYRGALGFDPDHRHLTFEELKLSSSISLSSSSDVLDGR